MELVQNLRWIWKFSLVSPPLIMDTGGILHDAFNLGWKLALVLKGYARRELLDTYESERRPVAEQVIWAASSLHDIFMTHGKDIAQRTPTMFDPGYTEKVVNTCSGVAYTYKDYIQNPP